MLIGEVEVHPAAQLFPEMGEEDFARLKKSISEHGIRVPLVFHEGRLVDGRNRLRAYLALGLPLARLPKEQLLPTRDPFLYAWDRNCERLDYTPGLKADIHAKVMVESGQLDRLRRGAEERANAARAEAAKSNGNAAKRRTENSRAPDDAPPISRDNKEKEARKTAAVLAQAAGVSTRTMERTLAKQKNGGAGILPADHPLQTKRPPAKNWSVPRDITLLSVFLRERLTSHERLRLARLLAE